MTISCDPCACPEAYYRDEFAFRQAVLILLSQAVGPLADGDCDPGRCPLAWVYDEDKWRQGVIFLLCALVRIVGEEPE